MDLEIGTSDDEKILKDAEKQVREILDLNTSLKFKITRSRMNFRGNVDPQTTYIDQGVSIGQDTVIYPHTVIEEKVRIGRRCQIGPFCRIGRKTVLGNEVQVANFVDLSDCRVANRTKIRGPARVNSGQVVR